MTSLTFHLGGALGKNFSRKPIRLEVPDIPQGMAMLCSRFGPMFRTMVRDGEFHVSKKPLKDCTAGQTLVAEEIPFGQRDGTNVYITPKVRAHGRNGWTIVMGVALVVAGFFTAGASWAGLAGGAANAGATFGLAGGIGGVIGGALVGVGASLALGGITAALAPKPKIDGPREQAGNNASFMFNGTVNVTEQGGPVPIIYGRVTRASSLVLSAGITSERLPPEVNASAG